MRNARLLMGLAFLGSSSLAFGYGLGVSTHPMDEGKRFVTGEFTGLLQNGKGLGVQFRYVQRLQEKFVVDAGLGVAGGERSNRVFAGVDSMIFPDYKYQPRTSIRTYVENAREFDSRHNILGVAPTVSKGFSFWEREAHPFLAIPLELNLNGKENSYQTSLRLALGATAPIAVSEGKNLVANLEANINLKSSYTGIFAGVSYPFN